MVAAADRDLALETSAIMPAGLASAARSGAPLAWQIATASASAA